MRTVPIWKSIIITCFLIIQTQPSSNAVAEKTSRKQRKGEEPASSPGTIVAGYLPDYRFYIDIESASMHLTDLILFSISPKNDGAVDISSTCCLDKSHFEQARRARKHKLAKTGQRLRIFASIGGAGRSHAFASIASDAERRRRLVSELKKLCIAQELDGIDFDWEMPQDSRQLNSYLQLIFEAYTSFQESNLLLSIALHPNQFLPPEAYNFLDRVHIMTYDMIPPSTSITSTNPFHHARYDLVTKSAQAFVQNGCPRSKILLGIPAYARHNQNPSLVKTYSEIIDHIQQKRSPTSSSIKSDLYQMSFSDGFAFDSPHDITRKIHYAKQEQFAGSFLWEIGQDSSLVQGGLLLEYAAVAANQTVTDSLGEGNDIRDSSSEL